MSIRYRTIGEPQGAANGELRNNTNRFGHSMRFRKDLPPSPIHLGAMLRIRKSYHSIFHTPQIADKADIQTRDLDYLKPK